MKKLFLLFTLFCTAIAMQAQVIQAYTMQATQGTYTEITDGTALDVTDIAAGDDISSTVWYPDGRVLELTTRAGFPIGFDFEYNDIICNQFVVGSQGFVAVGRDEISVDPSHGAYMFNRDGDGLSSLFGFMPNSAIKFSETTSITYQTTGEAPNRVFTLQYNDWNFSMDYSGTVLAVMDFQIKLYETSNNVEFVLGDLTTDSERTRDVRCGLRGTGEDIYTIAMEENEEGETTFTASSDNNRFAVGIGTIASGTTFTFTPPADCVSPESDINISYVESTTTSFSMEWSPVDDADHTLILLAKDYMLTQDIVDGEYYNVNDSLGNALVLAYTTDTIYKPEPEELVLEPATQYYLHIYVANSFCANGPVYGRGNNEIMIPFYTKPAAPASIDITSTTINSLTFDVESNGTDNVLVIMTDSVRELEGNYGFVAEFGNPWDQSTQPAVGDVFDDMGTVVYIGPSAQNVVVEGLEAGTAYYLRAHSYNASYDYSTDVVEDVDLTVSTLPWTLDFSQCELQSVPAGWESTGTSQYWKKTSATNGYGEDEYQFYMQITPNATDGHIADLTTPSIFVDKRDAYLTFKYCMYVWARSGNSTYDTWEANDKLAVQVSRNGGEFEDVHVITAENNVKVDSVNQFIPVSVDLSAYTNETIRVRIHWECFSTQKIRMPLEGWLLDGRPIPVVPEVSVSDITWNSANVTWRGEQETYEFAYAKAGEDFVTQDVADKTVALTDLVHLTDYEVKVRGIVAEGDTTEWSEVVTFTTLDLPACPVPEGLTHVTTDDCGDRLTWTLNEEHLSWDINYREGASYTWESVEGLETNEYTLYNLNPGAAYLWRVRAYCDMDRVSKWASQETFEANARSAISVADTDRLKVVASNGVINIYNSDVYVKSVALLDMQGRVIGNYAVNGRENITIPTQAGGIAIVLVNTVDKQLVYKVCVK